MKKSATGHGGARKDAGRKRLLDEAIGRTVSLVLSESELAEVDVKAQAAQLSRSSYIRKRLGFPPVKTKKKDDP